MNAKNFSKRDFNFGARLRTALCLLFGLGVSKASLATAPEVACRAEVVQGVNIFYREAGPQSGITLVLLHGFPASSFYFRNFIPLVGDKYHVVAPDYPGFGHSDTPAVDKFDYSFEHVAEVMEKFLEQKGNTNVIFFMQDYGAPIGMRIAVKHPEWIRGLIFQNGNVYEEGLLERFFLKKPLWEKRTDATEAPVLRNMEFDSVKYQYVHGARRPEEMSPDGWTMDVALLERPGNKAIQLELQADYASNLKKYPEWQAYLRTHQPPTLVVWGKNDPIFRPKGAEAFHRDVPDAEIHLLDTGHFALEEDSNAIADFTKDFLERRGIR